MPLKLEDQTNQELEREVRGHLETCLQMAQADQDATPSIIFLLVFSYHVFFSILVFPVKSSYSLGVLGLCHHFLQLFILNLLLIIIKQEKDTKHLLGWLSSIHLFRPHSTKATSSHIPL